MVQQQEKDIIQEWFVYLSVCVSSSQVTGLGHCVVSVSVCLSVYLFPSVCVDALMTVMLCVCVVVCLRLSVSIVVSVSRWMR